MNNTNFFSCAVEGSVFTRFLRQALTGVAIIAALNGPALAADPAMTTIVQEGQQGVAPVPVTFRRLGVIVLDFPDTPETMRAKFPTQAQWADIVRSDNLKQYFSVQSNHVFKYTTEILGVFRSAIPGWDPATGNAVQLDEIQARNNFNIPNFNANKYDELVLVSIHDAALPASQGGILRLNINGKYLERTGFFVAAQVGIWGRRSDYTYFSSLVAKDGFMIHAPNGQGVMGIVRLPLTRFERTFAHEFFHSMNTIPHVMTATNGTLPAHLPYNREAQCPSPCYVSDYTLQRLYYGLEYGNKFDVMGHTEYSQTLNAVFRDTLGWLNAKTRVSIKGYGKKTFIVSPEHFYDSTRAIEIRIPYKYAPTSDRRNQGYFLEARSAANPFNGMLVHPMLKGNTEGLFVFKTNGATSTLLDMSPSSNIIIGGTSVVPDLRDVVLKPGMTYENSEIRLSNVRKFNSGHFAVDVEVLR